MRLQPPVFPLHPQLFQIKNASASKNSSVRTFALPRVRNLRKPKSVFSSPNAPSTSSRAYVGSGHKRVSAGPKEQRIYELEKENRELQRANEILQEALGFFAKNRKK